MRRADNRPQVLQPPLVDQLASARGGRAGQYEASDDCGANNQGSDNRERDVDAETHFAASLSERKTRAR